MERLIHGAGETTLPVKIGLVLAGGGGKGAYHVGVWRALKEYEIDQHIVAISGTSVGALNGALFTSTSIIEAANVWSSISPDKILSFNTSGINRIFRKQINRKTFWDGGLIDNTPLLPLYDLGCSLILVVHLNRSTIIDSSNYPGAKIIEIFPRSSLGDFIDGTLDFSPSNAHKRMRQGYEDAKAILEPIFSTQKEILKKVSEFVQQEKSTYENLKSKLTERKQIKENLKEVLNESE